MELLSGIDFNTLPVWVIVIVIVLAFLPKVLNGVGVLIPPVGRYFEEKAEAQRERDETVLHWELESGGMALREQFQAQDKMLSLLEGSLEKMWIDREVSQSYMSEIKEEITGLRYQVASMRDILSVHGGIITKLSDEVVDMETDVKVVSERLRSFNVWAEEQPWKK